MTARTPALLGTGVVAGTVVGLGLTQGWWGSSALATGLGSTAAAATAGGVAGVGTVALIHAATTPCTGFDAVFSPFRPGPSGCVDGHYVGAEYTGPAGRRRIDAGAQGSRRTMQKTHGEPCVFLVRPGDGGDYFAALALSPPLALSAPSVRSVRSAMRADLPRRSRR